MLAHGLNALISMVLLFFLFALLVSAVMEAVASLLKLRGNALKVALETLVDDTRATGAGGFGIIDWAALHIPFLSRTQEQRRRRELPAVAANQPLTGSAIFKAIFEGSLVGGLRPRSIPTYIDPKQFAVALLSQFHSGTTDQAFHEIKTSIGTLPASRLKTTLLALANDAQGDYEALKTSVSKWFEESMARLSGEYKRFTQLFTFLIALFAAITFNVDAVRVGERLLADPLLAEAIAKVAAEEVKAGKPAAVPDAASPEEDYKLKRETVDAARAKLFTTYPFLGYDEDKRSNVFKAIHHSGGLSLLGWLLMAFSAVVGAPFWFDLLQRFINIRGAGPKPGGITPGDGK